MKSNTDTCIKLPQTSLCAFLQTRWLVCVIIGTLTCVVSCKKSTFLDQKTLSQISEQTIFTDSLNSLGYVNSRYNNITYSWEPNRWGQGGTESACDEAQPQSKPTELETYWQTGAINPSNIGSDIWATTYAQVRAVNIFLRDETTIPVTPKTKNAWEGQVRFLRAWYLATLLKTFGGFPIIGNTVYAQGDKIDVPRSTYDDCVKYITAECDAAAALLPIDYVALSKNVGDYGRVTRGSALGLKARVLLYAASPLINSSRADDPSHLVSYGNADVNRWKLAADAAQAVIDMGQYSLFRRVTPGFYNTFLNGLTNATPNPEIIFAYLPATSTANNMHLESLFNPATRGTQVGYSLPFCMPLQEMVDAFGMQNGKAITDPASNYPGMGDNMYLNRDPRFYNTITYNGGLRFLQGHSGDQPVWTYTGPVPNPASQDQAVIGAQTDGIYTANGTKTGYFCMKMLNDNTASGGAELNRPRIMIRYAEILLNAAEAYNEFSGPSAQIYTWLKDIRDRAGITPGTDGMYGMNASMTQSEMRTFLQNERWVELAYEEHRFWDVRRWKIAPAVLNKDMHGMEITRATSGSYSYRIIVVRGNVFRDNMYFFPIQQAELTKSAALKQNPGY
jgi:hypothetical protein